MSATVRPVWANAMPTTQRNTSCFDRLNLDLKLVLDRANRS